MTATEVEQAEPDESVPAPADRDWPRPWMNPFLRSLQLLPDISSACRVAHVGRSTVYDARNGTADRAATPGFAEAWDEALEMAKDLIQRQAFTWITTGVPIRSSKTVTKRKRDAAGNVLEETVEEMVSEGAERSSTLMIFWLKAWYPERYRWSERAEVTGVDGGPVQVRSLDAIDHEIERLAAEIAANAAADGEPVPVE